MSNTLRLIPLPPLPPKARAKNLGVPRRPSSCGAHEMPPSASALAIAAIAAPIAEPGEMRTIVVAPEPKNVEDRQKELSRRLDEVRSRNALLGLEEKRLETEIASVQEGLAINRRRLPLAKTVIASPCGVPWSEMQGDDRKRHCSRCSKDVHNLSAMTRSEVEEFLEANANGQSCVRLFERVDGTILTSDCPVGVRRRRARALVLASLGAGACALFGFSAIALMFSVVASEPLPQPRERVVVEVPGPKVFVQQSVPVMTIPAGYTQLPSAPEGMGWVLIHAPDGAKVFDGKRLIGTGATVVALSTGTHALHAEGSSPIGKKWSQSHDVVISSGGKTDVRFHGPELDSLTHAAGGMSVRSRW
jgi:hypothetical protein